jgi:hypothetical protein
MIQIKKATSKPLVKDRPYEVWYIQYMPMGVSLLSWHKTYTKACKVACQCSHVTPRPEYIRFAD